MKKMCRCVSDNCEAAVNINTLIRERVIDYYILLLHS